MQLDPPNPCGPDPCGCSHLDEMLPSSKAANDHLGFWRKSHHKQGRKISTEQPGVRIAEERTKKTAVLDYLPTTVLTAQGSLMAAAARKS